MGDGSKIRTAPNGPLLVDDTPGLTNSKGKSIETKEVAALCRCGRSDDKPFCDGTHGRVGFTSTRDTDGSKDQFDVYAGKAVTVHDNRAICAHAAICTEGLPAVFKYGQEPWIDPDGADVEAVKKQVAACPSGALTYAVDDVEHRDFGNEPGIYIAKNGPYVVKGGLALEDPETGQSPKTTDHYTLCRCGGSKNKPFCDGSHWQGFTDDKN